MENTPQIITRINAKKDNLKFYFTGHPCKNGHISKRYVSQTACLKCTINNGKEYRKNNAKKIKKKDMKYYISNKERILKQEKIYRKNNIEKISLTKKKYLENNIKYIHKKQKEYREINKQKISVKSKIYHDENKEVINKKRREYYSKNKNKVAAMNRKWAVSKKGRESRRMVDSKRKASKISTEDGTITFNSLEKLKKVQNNKCYYCANELDFIGKNKVHLDHYIPLSKGGPHSIVNVVYSCKTCNLTKSSKMPNSLLLI